MESLTLREATPDDLDRIMELEAKGFAPGNREMRAVYERRIEAFPQGALMACLGAQSIGCVFSEIWCATPVPVAEHFALGHDILDRHDPVRGTELYIASMTIDPAFRGRGLAMPCFAGSIAHVAQAFPVLTSVVLLVNETWHGARRLYVAAGFREVARFDGFFRPSGSHGEDGIVMRRCIGGS